MLKVTVFAYYPVVTSGVDVSPNTFPLTIIPSLKSTEIVTITTMS